MEAWRLRFAAPAPGTSPMTLWAACACACTAAAALRQVRLACAVHFIAEAATRQAAGLLPRLLTSCRQALVRIEAREPSSTKLIFCTTFFVLSNAVLSSASLHQFAAECGSAMYSSACRRTCETMSYSCCRVGPLWAGLRLRRASGHNTDATGHDRLQAAVQVLDPRRSHRCCWG